MDKKQFFLNVFIIFILVGLVVLLTTYARPIREKVQIPYQLVAGARTVSFEEEKEKLPGQLIQGAKDQIAPLGEEAMNMTVEEILTFFSRSGKIVNDLRALQLQLQEIVRHE